jgi:hypothetical protein
MSGASVRTPEGNIDTLITEFNYACILIYLFFNKGLYSLRGFDYARILIYLF